MAIPRRPFKQNKKVLFILLSVLFFFQPSFAEKAGHMEIQNRMMPSSEQLSNLDKSSEAEPFFVLNLIKYSDRAEYADGRETDLTGREAYALYGRDQLKHLREIGAEVVISGWLNGLIIGNIEPQHWESFAVIKFPNKSAFQSFFADLDWIRRNEHRVAGLDGQLLFSTKITGVKELFRLSSAPAAEK